jgi:hypothetical protein
MQTQEPHRICVHLAPEDLGFGMWAHDATLEDSVDYVDHIREATNKPLCEIIEELSERQRSPFQNNIKESYETRIVSH